MTMNSGPANAEPTLLSDLFELTDASIQQGRAIERVDHPAAATAHRRALAALGRILQRVGEDRIGPAEFLISPASHPHPGTGGGINT